jgi:hypothetical protein
VTRDQVKAILDRVLTWPPERQADIAHVVEAMEEQDKSDLRLSEEQAAEVRRRLADPNRKTIPAEEALQAFTYIRRMRVAFAPATAAPPGLPS